MTKRTFFLLLSSFPLVALGIFLTAAISSEYTVYSYNNTSQVSLATKLIPYLIFLGGCITILIGYILIQKTDLSKKRKGWLNIFIAILITLLGYYISQESLERKKSYENDIFNALIPPDTILVSLKYGLCFLLFITGLYKVIVVEPIKD